MAQTKVTMYLFSKEGDKVQNHHIGVQENQELNYVTGTKIGDGTHKKGMEQPVHHWIPSIAASSIMLYDGDQFPACHNILWNEL